MISYQVHLSDQGSSVEVPQHCGGAAAEGAGGVQRAEPREIRPDPGRGRHPGLRLQRDHRPAGDPIREGLRGAVLGDRTAVCRHVEGESFLVEGENLVFSADQKISLYALAAILPLLPAKQRDTDPNDWMSTDAEVACPDPHCGARFRIESIGNSD